MVGRCSKSYFISVAMPMNSDSTLIISEINSLLESMAEISENSSTTPESSQEYEEIEGISKQHLVGETPPTYSFSNPDKESLSRDRERVKRYYWAVGRKLHRQHRPINLTNWRSRYQQSCGLLHYFVEISTKKKKSYLAALVRRVSE